VTVCVLAMIQADVLRSISTSRRATVKSVSSAYSDSGLSSLLSTRLSVSDDDDDSILDDHLSRVWSAADADTHSANGAAVALSLSARSQHDHDAAAALCDAVRRLEHSDDTDARSCCDTRSCCSDTWRLDASSVSSDECHIVNSLTSCHCHCHCHCCCTCSRGDTCCQCRRQLFCSDGHRTRSDHTTAHYTLHCRRYSIDGSTSCQLLPCTR